MAQAELDWDELLNLLHASFVSHYVPDKGVYEEISMYSANAVKYTNPYWCKLDDAESESRVRTYAEQEAAFFREEKTENFWHWPLLSIGDARGNSSFARCSVCHTQPDVLYVSFRPLDIDGIEEIARRDYFYVGALQKYFLPGLIRPCVNKRSVDNTMSLINDIHDPELDPDTGMSMGYDKIVNKDMYPVTIENVTSLRQAGVKRPVIDLQFDANTTTMANAVVRLIEHNNNSTRAARSNNHFREVVFTGFSLGSGTALVSAYSVHKLLESRQQQRGVDFIMPKFTCVQFSGTTVGNAVFEAEVKSRGISTYYVALENSAEEGLAKYDPVPYMPFNQAGRVHVADKFIVMDFSTPPSIKVGQYQPDLLHGKVSRHALMQMAAGYLLNWNDSTDASRNCGLTGFKKTHLEGEKLITCTLFSMLCQQDRGCGWVTRVPWVGAPDRESVTGNVAAKRQSGACVRVKAYC